MLKDLIIHSLKQTQEEQITFKEYMEILLYHPQYGYYASQLSDIGKEGDFFTAPSLGKDFGELLAIQFAEMWQILSRPTPFALVEMGAGNGSLAVDILNYLEQQFPDLSKCLHYIIVESSPLLQAFQRRKVRDNFNDLSIISWQSWKEIPNNSVCGCFFSNELVDAFPVHRLAVESGNLKEVYLTHSQGEIREELGELSNLDIINYFHNIAIEFPSPMYGDGYRTEVNLVATHWLKTVADKLKRGYLLTIDYGLSAQKYYHPQRVDGTLQCYFQHRRHNNPYLNMGQQDITTHVNFTALEKYGAKFGLKLLGLSKQGIFLMTLGLGDRLTQLSSEEYDLATILKRRDALHQLINPTGLGDFGVLVQAKGLNQDQLSASLSGLRDPLRLRKSLISEG